MKTRLLGLAVALGMLVPFAAGHAQAQSKGLMVVFMPPGTDNYLAQWQKGARAKAKDAELHNRVIMALVELLRREQQSARYVQQGDHAYQQQQHYPPQQGQYQPQGQSLAAIEAFLWPRTSS